MNNGSRKYELASKDGMALISALGVLMIFTVLGTAYVRYMSYEYDKTKYIVQEVRSRALAQGGINAAIGEIEQALKDGKTPNAVYNFQLPVFIREGEGLREEAQTVTVRVSDEASRVNINHASKDLLSAMGFTRSGLNNLSDIKADTSVRKKHRVRSGPLASVNELRTRNVVGSRDYHNLDTDLMTVYTSSGVVNINTAAPRVLAAVFGIELGDARVLASKRPFTSWANAVEKVGRDASTFNVSSAGGSIPEELSLTSNAYRLISEATVRSQGARQRGVRGIVEAVVIFEDDGGTNIRFWSEVPVERLNQEVVGPEMAEEIDDEDDEEEEDDKGEDEGEEETEDATDEASDEA